MRKNKLTQQDDITEYLKDNFRLNYHSKQTQT